MIALFPYQAACLVPFGAVLILSRAHVAFGNSAVLPRIGILAAATNLLFDVLLGRAIGLPGIALATFVTHTVVALTLFREFRYADPGCDARAVHRTSS
jgi:peptidoglycan biosynthesis protein MviN/MurJ (putative lipid II flippase)